jgi:hypothetical protein
MDLREIGLGGVDWIRLVQDRDRWRAVVSAVMNLRFFAPRSKLGVISDLPLLIRVLTYTVRGCGFSLNNDQQPLFTRLWI